jgi:hypothetical protein
MSGRPATRFVPSNPPQELVLQLSGGQSMSRSHNFRIGVVEILIRRCLAKASASPRSKFYPPPPTMAGELRRSAEIQGTSVLLWQLDRRCFSGSYMRRWVRSSVCRPQPSAAPFADRLCLRRSSASSTQVVSPQPRPPMQLAAPQCRHRRPPPQVREVAHPAGRFGERLLLASPR